MPPISSGVLQGSVIGPILFNVFINQLLKRLPSNNAVAEDLTLVGIGDFPVSVNQQMQHLLDIVYNWSINNSLVINTSKCYAMYITGSTRRHAAQPNNSSFLLGKRKCEHRHRNQNTRSAIIYIGPNMAVTAELRMQKSQLLVSVVHHLGKSLNVDARKKSFMPLFCHI